MTAQQSLRFLVLNAGGTFLPDKDASIRWVNALLSDASWRPDVACIQEVPSGAWLDAWRGQDYNCILGASRGFKVHSAILTTLRSEQLCGISEEEVPELGYHGEYLAAGRLTLDSGAEVTVISMHASPKPTTPDDLQHHPDPTRLRARKGNDPRFEGALFDSDVVLDTVARQAPVLACGDLNEARGWDGLPGKEGQTWGVEFFGSTDLPGRVQEAGLEDVPLSSDGREVVTRRSPGHPELQLDHILVSPSLRERVSNARLDEAWPTDVGTVPGLADHAPLWFDFAL